MIIKNRFPVCEYDTSTWTTAAMYRETPEMVAKIVPPVFLMRKENSSPRLTKRPPHPC